MAIDPPYRLDPLQNPSDVNWGGAEIGLALFRFPNEENPLLSKWIFLVDTPHSVDTPPTAEFSEIFTQYTNEGWSVGGVSKAACQNIHQFDDLAEAQEHATDFDVNLCGSGIAAGNFKSMFDNVSSFAFGSVARKVLALATYISEEDEEEE